MPQGFSTKYCNDTYLERSVRQIYHDSIWAPTIETVWGLLATATTNKRESTQIAFVALEVYTQISDRLVEITNKTLTRLLFETLPWNKTPKSKKNQFPLWTNEDQEHCIHFLKKATKHFEHVWHAKSNPTQSHQLCDDIDGEIFRTCKASKKKKMFYTAKNNYASSSLMRAQFREVPTSTVGWRQTWSQAHKRIEHWPTGLLLRTEACDIVLSHQGQTQCSWEYDHCLTSKFLPRMVEDARDRGRQAYQIECNGL